MLVIPGIEGMYYLEQKFGADSQDIVASSFDVDKTNRVKYEIGSHNGGRLFPRF